MCSVQPWSNYARSRLFISTKEAKPSATLASWVLSKLPKCIHNSMVAQLQSLPFLLKHINQKRKHFLAFGWVIGTVDELVYAVIFPRRVNKSCLSYLFFTETTVLRLTVNYKTFIVVILNDICVLALNDLNVTVNTLWEHYRCNYKH